jgi:AraC family ethanolamine operon transcriptional activator
MHARVYSAACIRHLDRLQGKIMDRATQPQFLHLHGFDPDLLDTCVADHAVTRHMQIGPGHLDGELGRIPLATGTLHTCRHSVGVRVQGQFPAGHVFLLLCLDVPARSRILGRDVARDTVVAFGPGAIVDNLYGAGMCWAGLSVPVDEFTHAVRAGSILATGIGTGTTLIQQPKPAAIAALRAALASMTDFARHQPKQFDDARWRSGAEHNLLDAYIGALDSPTDDRQRTNVAAPSRADSIVQSLDNYLDTVNGMVPVAELCRVAHLPRRTLERAYQQTLRIGPAEYVRRRALNAVRRELLHGIGTMGSISITETAMRHGFWHLGRFAGYYRTLFGESPSATLHRHTRTASRQSLLARPSP